MAVSMFIDLRLSVRQIFMHLGYVFGSFVDVQKLMVSLVGFCC